MSFEKRNKKKVKRAIFVTFPPIMFKQQVMNFRKYFFYIIDYLNGGQIHKNIAEIKFFNNNHEEAKKNALNKTRELLKYANANVPFYIRNNIFELHDAPVLNKSHYKSNFQDFMSNKFKKHQLFKVVTSGSTGTPFTSYQDRRKKNRNISDTIFFGEKANFSLGKKLYYIKIWNEVNKKSLFQQFLENIVCVDATKQSEQNILCLAKQLEKHKSKVALLGYASFFDVFVKVLLENNIKLTSIGSALAMSEGLSLETKKKFLDLTQIELLSRYSNVENGIIAQQIPDSGSIFRINWASYFIEILGLDSDEYCSYGEAGRIVVTDLYNFAMPFIRYDTGDIGVMSYSEKYQQPVLKRVEGRKMDLIYNTKGELLSSFIITNNMWLFPEVRQYQFIQSSKKSYKFLLNVSWDKNVKEKQILEVFLPLLGNDASIIFEYTDEIPLLNSGKRRKVVNEFWDKTIN